jgi:hypothetical protein
VSHAHASDPRAGARYRAREEWRSAWQVGALRAHDVVLGLDVVLVRSATLALDLPSVSLPEDAPQVMVLGIEHDPSSATTALVERDQGQRLLPERLAIVDALWALHGAAASDALLRAHGAGELEFGIDALRVLPSGAVVIVAAAGRRASDVVIDRSSAGDASTRTLRRLATQLAEAVRRAGDDPSALERIADEAATGGSGAWLRERCAHELAATGVEPRLLARRVADVAAASEADTRVPSVAGHDDGDDPFERWDDLQLQVRTWNGALRGRLLLITPLALLLAVLGASIFFANDRDEGAARGTTTVEQMRAIGASTGDEQREVEDALHDWTGDAAGLVRLRAAGRDLRTASDDAAQDASHVKLTSVSEAEAHGALRGMLTAQQALSDVLIKLPTDERKVEAASFQDALLRTRVVLSDFIGLGVALGSLGQQPIREEGYASLPESAERSLDVAIEAEADRFAGSREREQQRLQRELQDRLLASMEEQQRIGTERLRAAQAEAGDGLGDVQGEVLRRMSAAWETRYEAFAARAKAIERQAATLTASPTLACSASLQAKLQATILARQQLVLEVNTTAAPTDDGLRRQVALVTALGSSVRRDQLVLQRLRTPRASEVAPDAADAADAAPDPALAAAEQPAACA